MAALKPTSPFAELLRRSKFASYDPSIGQVYSSYGGHLHRGNWGLKRPLPIRRRDAHIAVNAVDSREEQTEWKYADKEARFTKMWEEVGVTPQVIEGPWQTKLGPAGEAEWKMDSEFASEGGQVGKGVQTQWSRERDEVYGPASTAVPNVDAMSDAEFERYLDGLRQLRPTFGVFLKGVAQNRTKKLQQATTFDSFWRSSWASNRDHTMFLRAQAHQTFNSPESRAIEQQPQTFGGLTYTKASALQTQLLHKPQPGRIVGTVRGSTTMVASFAGMAPTLHAIHRKGLGKVDWWRLATYGERDPQEGAESLRLSRVLIERISQVVGKKPQDLHGTSINARVVAADAVDMAHANHYPPGSKEYIAHDGKRYNSYNSILSTKEKKSKSESFTMPTNKAAVDSNKLLGTLHTLVNNNRPIV